MKLAGVALLFSAAAWGESAAMEAYHRANSLFVARDFTACEKAIEEALRHDSRLIPALTLRAKLGMATNRFSMARESLERAVTIAPKSGTAQFLLGFQFYLQNELHLAIRPLQEARRLAPADPRVPLYLALTYESLGEADRALEHYRDAVRLEERSPQPHAETLLAFARMLLVIDRLEECASILDRAMKLEPQSRDVRYERARLLLKRGEAAAAAKEAETALRFDSAGVAEHQIRYLLVRAYAAAGDDLRAAEEAAHIRAGEAGK